MIGIVFATVEEANPFLSRYQRGRFDGLSEGETLPLMAAQMPLVPGRLRLTCRRQVPPTTSS